MTKVLRDLPDGYVILTDMPMSPAYHFDCLWNPGGIGWISIKEIHPMCDLHRHFVKQGIVAFFNKHIENKSK